MIRCWTIKQKVTHNKKKIAVMKWKTQRSIDFVGTIKIFMGRYCIYELDWKSFLNQFRIKEVNKLDEKKTNESKSISKIKYEVPLSLTVENYTNIGDNINFQNC